MKTKTYKKIKEFVIYQIINRRMNVVIFVHLEMVNLSIQKMLLKFLFALLKIQIVFLLYKKLCNFICNLSL